MSNPYAFNVQPIPQTEVTPTDIKRVVKRDDLSEDQVNVYDDILSWVDDPNGRQYLKVGGYAGTGKTTLVAALAKELESRGEKINYAAFTGKAVNVMSRKLRQAGIFGEASTLHSLMYRPKVDSKGHVEGWEKKELLPCSMVVVDEASMVGADLWEDLRSFDIPILAVGDHGQLPPVGDGTVNLMQSPDLRLERIHRQAEGNPILALAQHVREGKSHHSFNPVDSRVAFIPSFAAVAERIVNDSNNVVGLCYTNRTRASMNRFVRQLRGWSGGPQEYDTVICLRNKKPIFNGMRGQLSEVDAEHDEWGCFGGKVDFADDNLMLTAKFQSRQFGAPKTIDKLEMLSSSNFNKFPHSWDQAGMLFDYGYALTCHKAQGSQWKEVAIVWENLFRDADTRARWMYTAVTRASDKLWIVRP